MVGIAILKGVRGAVQAALCLSIVGLIATVAGSFGWLYAGQVFVNGESRLSLFHLLAVLATGGCLLTSTTLFLDHWNHGRTSKKFN